MCIRDSTSTTHHHVVKMSTWCWVISPFYDFCSSWSMAVNTIDKLQFLSFILIISLTTCWVTASTDDWQVCLCVEDAPTVLDLQFLLEYIGFCSVCRDGVQQCDVLIAALNACDMVTGQQQVDVFQVACHVKQAQPHFFTRSVSRVDYYFTYTSVIIIRPRRRLTWSYM